MALEAGERGVQGAERDVRDEPELVAQEPADLVAVAVLLSQEAEDREVEHGATIAVRYIERSDDGEPDRRGAARSTAPRRARHRVEASGRDAVRSRAPARAGAGHRWRTRSRRSCGPPLASPRWHGRRRARRRHPIRRRRVRPRAPRARRVAAQGTVRREDVCDAHPELLRAAQHLGRAARSARARSATRRRPRGDLRLRREAAARWHVPVDEGRAHAPRASRGAGRLLRRGGVHGLRLPPPRAEVAGRRAPGAARRRSSGRSASTGHRARGPAPQARGGRRARS